MKKIALILFLLTTCCEYVWADTRIYTLNQMEVEDGTGNNKNVPILTLEKKPTSMKLVIVGLPVSGKRSETDRVTAQCPILSLSKETQIYLMDKPDNGTGDNGSQWYYIIYNQGVTIIELKGNNVKIHNLGSVPFTYVGKYDTGTASLH